MIVVRRLFATLFTIILAILLLPISLFHVKQLFCEAGAIIKDIWVE